jgi:hypothetical protein
LEEERHTGIHASEWQIVCKILKIKFLIARRRDRTTIQKVEDKRAEGCKKKLKNFEKKFEIAEAESFSNFLFSRI